MKKIFAFLVLTIFVASVAFAGVKSIKIQASAGQIIASIKSSIYSDGIALDKKRQKIEDIIATGQVEDDAANMEILRTKLLAIKTVQIEAYTFINQTWEDIDK